MRPNNLPGTTFPTHAALRRISKVKVKRAIDPQAFYLKELGIRKFDQSVDWQDAGPCPFHNGYRTGARFRVNLNTGAFRCRACDAYGGDILAFLMDRDRLVLPDALARLAREWEVQP